MGEEFDEEAEMNFANYAYSVADPEPEEPRSIAEAQSSPAWPHWQVTIAAEMEQHAKRGTWLLVDRPFGKINVVGCRFVFRLKRDGTGRVVKYKARLVAQGFSQRDGVNYYSDDTFASVAKMASVRGLFSMAAARNEPIRHWDVEGVYLYS